MASLAFIDRRISFIRWLFWLFLLMAVASILAATIFPQVGINFKDFGKPRWIGITTHPNALGASSLVLTWLATNLLFLTRSKLEKTLIFFATIISFFIMIKADSMTSLITSIFITFYIIYLYLFSGINSSIKLFLYTVAFFIALLTFTFYKDFSEIVNIALSSTGRNTTFTGRALLWQRAFMAVGKNIIFGYGFDNLEQLSKMYHLQMAHLHNGYVEILVKGGLVASVLLSIVILKTYFKQLKIKHPLKHEFIFLHTGLVMILMHNFTESSILKGLNTLGILIIYIIVSTSIAESNFKINKPISNA